MKYEAYMLDWSQSRSLDRYSSLCNSAEIKLLRFEQNQSNISSVYNDHWDFKNKYPPIHSAENKL